jgi:hypothetical protein
MHSTALNNALFIVYQNSGVLYIAIILDKLTQYDHETYEAIDALKHPKVLLVYRHCR